jgi:hypothetical protein
MVLSKFLFKRSFKTYDIFSLFPLLFCNRFKNTVLSKYSFWVVCYYRKTENSIVITHSEMLVRLEYRLSLEHQTHGIPYTVELHLPRSWLHGSAWPFWVNYKITGYPIKYSTVFWLLELEIRRGRKV